MSRLSTSGRKRVATKNFVFPRGTKADPGDPKFPINDRPHARNALSRAGQKRTKLTKAERCKVVAAVCKKFPKLGLCETGKVSAKSALKRAGCVTLVRAAKKKKAAPKKTAAPKRSTRPGRWKADPRGGRSRTYRDAQGFTVHQWEMVPRGPKRYLYLYKPSAKPGEGLSIMATSLDDAKRQVEKSYQGTAYDLSKVRKATPAEIRSYANAYWD